VLEAARSTLAAMQLAEYFGGDPSSADWRHFGRLADFTNRSLSDNWPQDYDHSRGCGQPKAAFILAQPSFLLVSGKPTSMWQ
jgi:RepB DNA-primase from phage plasmid